MIETALSRSDAWQRYVDGRRTFSTAFWLHYLGGLVGAHRFYVGRIGSGIAQLVLGLGSLVAMWALSRVWGAGAAVFVLPLLLCGAWLWWDTYNVRDLVRGHNRALADRVGLKRDDVERWEEAQAELGS